MVSPEVVEQSVREVLETAAGSPVVSAAVCGPDGQRFEGVVGMVGFSGGRTGTLVVYCEPGVATQIASGMLGMSPEEVDPGLLADAIGELVNQIGGTLKRRLAATSDGEFALSVPSVACGSAVRVTVVANVTPVGLEVRIGAGPVHVRLWLSA
ncbi:MAG: chemotaxis protein CheX [Candidatus Binatia bacterium]